MTSARELSLRGCGALLLTVALLAAAPAAVAQNRNALVGIWSGHVAEAGSGPGGFDYESFRWVRRLGEDGAASVELRFYQDAKPVLEHAEEGTWGLQDGWYWFQCASVTRGGAKVPCDRRAEYEVIGIDATTLQYRARGSERVLRMERVPGDFKLP